MANPPARQTAPELLAIPIVTDGDVLDRVAAIVSPAARRHRTRWLFFLHRNYRVPRWFDVGLCPLVTTGDTTTCG